MLERGPQRLPQVVLGGHVVDGVVDQHGVEGPAQPHRAHVALVLAPGVEPPGDPEHAGGEVDQGQREPRLQVHGVVPAAAAQLEHGLDRTVGDGQQ